MLSILGRKLSLKISGIQSQFLQILRLREEGVSFSHRPKVTGAEVLAVGCPFCMQMFETAKSSVADGPVVKDVVELIAEGLPVTSNGKTAEAAGN
jgi:Fe-S oxidoreductase